jgi:hypothetical protein
MSDETNEPNKANKLCNFGYDATEYIDHTLIKINDDINVVLYSDIDGDYHYAWNNKKEDETLTEKLLESIKYVKNMKLNANDDMDVLILKYFTDYFTDTPGFDMAGNDNLIDIEDYVGSNDVFWKKLQIRHKVNMERHLKVYTYGTTFTFEPPKGCQAIYNACIIRSKIDNKDLRKKLSKLRGTDKKIQTEVRSSAAFESFVGDIVRDIEHNNYNTIAVICRAGHHRSVACAEMLANIYPNRKVHHLNINN